MCLCVWVNKERENYITRERWEKFISAKGGSFPTTGLYNSMLFSDSSQSWPNQISWVDLISKTLQNVSFKDAAALYLSCAPLNVFVPQCPLLMASFYAIILSLQRKARSCAIDSSRFLFFVFNVPTIRPRRERNQRWTLLCLNLVKYWSVLSILPHDYKNFLNEIF